jgi:myo-inositol 2-dehydrogenase/D-chiro-inositol 1-dehydrogenase
MAISENHALNNMRLYTDSHTDQGAPLMNFFIERYGAAFAAEIGAFVDAVEEKTAPAVSFEDGRQALILAESALRSMAEGRTVKTSEIG